jgi:hypothetical protein
LIDFTSTTLILFLINLFIIYQFFKKNKTFVVGLYCTQILLLYLTPFAYYLIAKYSYSGYGLLAADNALQYLFLYNFVLITIYSVSTNLLGQIKFKILNYKYFFSEKSVIWTAGFFVIISVLADCYLYSIGKIKGEHPRLTNFTDIASNLISVKIAAVIFLSNYLKTNDITRKNIAFYIIIWIILIVTLFFNFQKYNFFILFALVVYLHIEFICLHKKKFIVFSILSLLLYMVFAPAFDLYKYKNITLASSVDLALKKYIGQTEYPAFSSYKITFFINRVLILIRESFCDIFSDRLNYIGPLSRIFELGNFERTLNYSSYFDNIIGLVPRFLWSDKPTIGIDGNFIGHNLNIIDSKDNLTSIALGSIGESYYLLGFLGLTIAAFQGLLMAMLDKFSIYKNYIFSVLYFFISLEIILISSYSLVIPKIVKIIFTYCILMLVFQKILGVENTQNKKTSKNN